MNDPRRVINLAKDFQKCMKNLPNFTDNQVRLEDWDQDALTYINIVIQPNDGLYKGGSYKFKIEFGEKYPDNSPLVKSMSPIYHPNIDYDNNYYSDHPNSSAVCLNLFGDDWDSSSGIEDIIQGLLFLFYHPNLDDPLTPAFGNEVPEDKSEMTKEDIFKEELEQALKGERPSRVDDESIVFKPMDELKCSEEDVQKSRMLLERSDSLVNELTRKAIDMEQEIQKRRWRIASLKKATTVAYYPSPNITNVVHLGLKVSVVREWFNAERLQAEQRKIVTNEFVQFQTQIEGRLQAWPTYKQQSFNFGSDPVIDNTTHVMPTAEAGVTHENSDPVMTVHDDKCNYLGDETGSTNENQLPNPQICNDATTSNQSAINPMSSPETNNVSNSKECTNCSDNNKCDEEPMDTETAMDCEPSTGCELSADTADVTPPVVTNCPFYFSYTDVKPAMRKCTTFAIPSQINNFTFNKKALQEWRMTLS